MKFSVLTKELNNSLKAVASTGAENIIVFAKPDTSIEIVGEGEVTSIKTTTTALSVEEEGKAVLNTRFVTDIAKKAGSDEISFSSNEENKLIQIKAGKSKFKLNTESNDPVHSSFDLADASTFSLLASKLKEMLDRISYAAAVKEVSRPILTGINLSSYDGYLKAVATDSYRLAQDEVHQDGIADFNITIPVSAVSSLQSTLLSDCEEKDMLTISVSGSKAVFSKGETLLKTRLLDGAYPEVGRLIPSSYAYGITVNRENLIDLLERSLFLKDKGEMATVSLSFGKDTPITISSDSQEIGSFQEELDGKTDCVESFGTDFAANYMLDILKHVSSDEVTIQFVGKLKPMTITAGNALHLMLPVRKWQ